MPARLNEERGAMPARLNEEVVAKPFLNLALEFSFPTMPIRLPCCIGETPIETGNATLTQVQRSPDATR